MEDCIFCKIISKQSPAEIEYEDKDIIAFWDKNPKAPVHILIIPKKHIPSLMDVKVENEALMGKVIAAAQKVALKKNLTGDGFRLVVNTGPASGQVVDHLHFHLLGGRQLGPMG